MELHRGFSPLDPRHKNLQKRPDLHRGPSIKPRPPPPHAQSGREKRRLRLGRPRESITPGTELNKADGGLDWRGGGARPRGGVLSINEVPPTASSPGSEGWREGSTVMTAGVGDGPRLHQPSIRAPEGPVKLTPARLPTPTATGWAAKSVREVGAAARGGGGSVCVLSGLHFARLQDHFPNFVSNFGSGPKSEPWGTPCVTAAVRVVVVMVQPGQERTCMGGGRGESCGPEKIPP